MRSWFGKVLCVVTLAVCAGAAVADDAPQVAGRLKRDVAAGALSGDDAALYAALAIVEPRSLPEQYALSTGDDCGMELLGILYATLQNADPEVRDAVRYVMSPHERSRMERPGKVPGTVEALADPWLSEATVHFRIHYTTTGPDATTQQNAREFLQSALELLRRLALPLRLLRR